MLTVGEGCVFEAERLKPEGMSRMLTARTDILGASKVFFLLVIPTMHSFTSNLVVMSEVIRIKLVKLNHGR